jgi:hypothetical protein
VRPVREQLEHDRVVRLLQTRYRRRFEVGINPGAEQNAAVGSGPSAIYPDLVMTSTDRGHRLQAVVEVESSESVNHLEALSQWKPFSALRAEFYLYVPSGSVDAARRLLTEYAIPCTELWTYHAIGDQIRFALAQRARPERRPSAAAPAKRAVRPAAAASGTGRRRTTPARSARASRPTRSTKATAASRAARPAKGKTTAKSSRVQKRK